jgi:DNA-binding IclR family transcriptional regulator
VTLFRTSQEDHLLRRVRREFREMPGMRLTLDQAIRLWTMDRSTCTGVFDSLVAARFLEQDATGRYRKTHGG